MVTHFTKCADNIESTTGEAKNPELTKQRKRKQRSDRQLCNLIFCTAVHCSATFDKLESHIVKGIHSVPKAASSFDYVKKSFANRMIQAARPHLFVTSSPTASASNASGVVIPLFLHKDGVYLSGQHVDSMLVKKLFLFKAFEMERQLGKRKAQRKSIWP